MKLSRFVMAGAWVLLAGCSKSSTSFKAPAVVPLLKQSLPTSLGGSYDGYMAGTVASRIALPSALTVANSANAAVAAASISALFQDNYVDINGQTNLKGYIYAQVGNIDERMAIINSMASTGSHGCLNHAPQSYDVDLSSIDPMLKLTLTDLQCTSSFNGNSNGSGAVFGGANDTFSLWTSLGGLDAGSYTSGGGFMAFANVSNVSVSEVDGGLSVSADGGKETVDGMFTAYFPQSDINEVTMVRYKASPNQGTFEMSLASNRASLRGPSGSDPDPWLGAGFRMISDATHIYADGKVWNTTTTTWEAFTACLNASDMSVDATATDCNTLAGSFTLAQTQALTYNEVTGATGAVPAPGTVTQATPPTTPVVNALNAIFPITNAASVASTF
jgi:hypothetical protein